MTGITLGHEPVLLRTGLFVLRPSAVVLLAGLALGVWLSVRAARRLGLSTREALDLASWTLLGGLAGARLFDLVEHLERYLTHPGELLDPATGLSFWGGLAGGWVAFARVARRRGWSLARLADGAAPGLALGEAIGRLSQLLAGQGQGLPSNLPWATSYLGVDALSPDLGIPRHPAQAYQGLADLAIFGLLQARPLKLAPPGTRSGAWLLTYGLARLAVGFVRLEPPFLFDLQLGQLLGLLAMAIGGSVMIRSIARSSRAAPRHP